MPQFCFLKCFFVMKKNHLLHFYGALTLCMCMCMCVATCSGMGIEDRRQTADLQEPVLGVFG